MILDEMAKLNDSIRADAKAHGDKEVQRDLMEICEMVEDYMREIAPLEAIIEHAKTEVAIGRDKDEAFSEARDELLSKYLDAPTYGAWFNKLRSALGMESST